MLSNPVYLFQARFAKELGELILYWAYNWLRGKGGYCVEQEGGREQLPPAMRLVEVADFSFGSSLRGWRSFGPTRISILGR